MAINTVVSSVFLVGTYCRPHSQHVPDFSSKLSYNCAHWSRGIQADKPMSSEWLSLTVPLCFAKAV